ncbi:ribosome small subunit-dependent GTPase A [Facklamia miroungae]|uniref:Small ribosomal subunit biogenesis GTPase RsgA n=1 Tax=Facklamia miroungae TaxID=120956 RepID=A0A1G7V4C5_9LACT|nr:ribosome small subunit-dependent GTPase A [Facklamia miroungae]NKZ30230.1 ribosome small subunit-dependent GTPase A [Facklamia miroungae]SDG54219.1 ribosome biogenesis GTPase [Facklamia miroungae]
MTIIDYGITNYIREQNLINDLNVFRVTGLNYSTFTLHNRYNESIKVPLGTEESDITLGDFVQVEEVNHHYFILRKFERVSVISKAASTAKKSYAYNEKEQALAANVDQLFILIAADQRFSLSKFERYYLTFTSQVAESHVVISKSDFIKETERIQSIILNVYPNVDIHEVTVFDKEKTEKFKNMFKENKTSILLGASGVGKSTLINRMMQQSLLNTQPVRRDGKGKHTTTSSSLYYLEQTNSYIIDTPGFKTIATHKETDDSVLFQEIYNLSQECRFNDCSHTQEPGCAIQSAIKSGNLSSELYDRYLLIRDKEIRYKNFLSKKASRKKQKKPMKVITKSGVRY